MPTGEATKDGSGWVAVVPADGSAQGRDIGDRIEDTSETSNAKVWSPDGRYVLQWIESTATATIVDVATGTPLDLPSVKGVPDWQRLAP